MKKALVIILALSLVTGVFATEPVADLNLADFEGWASVTFGVDLDTGKTGFKNETGVTLKLNFLTESDKSTTGEGIWGELKILLDGDVRGLVDDKVSGTKPIFEAPELKIDVATLHISDFYIGIKSDDLPRDAGFKYPNALNYDDGDDAYTASTGKPDLVRNRSMGMAGYNQGFVLGYKNDMFKIEANLRSRQISEGDIQSITEQPIDPNHQTDPGSPPGTIGFNPENWTLKTGVASTVAYIGNDISGGAYVNPTDSTQWFVWGIVYEVLFTTEDGDFWSGDYAASAYVEVKPITDLRIAAGVAFVLHDSFESEYSEGNEQIHRNQTGDLSFFAGAEYKMPLGETFSIQPVIAYSMYQANEKTVSEDFIKYRMLRNRFGMGLRFGWGESEDSSSLLNDFFKTDLVYNVTDTGDDDLLPGISVSTALSFIGLKKQDSAEYINPNDVMLPLMVTAYSGDIAAVPGLKAYGLFYINMAPQAKGTFTKNDTAEDALATVASLTQIGFAASYEIKAGDITITPALGALVSINELDSTQGGEKITGTKNTMWFEAKTDIAGLVPNTTFTVAWDTAKFVDAKINDVAVTMADPDKKNGNGEFTIKIKIAL